MLKRTIPFILFVLTCVFLARGLQLNPQAMPSAQIGKQLPASIDLQGMQGQLIILHFWASWCDSCNQDVAELKELHQKTHAKLLGVNYKDTAKALQRWLTINQNIFDGLIIDKQGLIAMDLGVVATPETFLIDKKGIIRYRHQGPLTMEIINKKIVPILQEYNK